MEKTIREKEIVKVTQVRMSMTCFIYCVNVTAFLEGNFPNFNLTCKENNVHSSLLIDMFGKAEMR